MTDPSAQPATQPAIRLDKVSKRYWQI
ncbi:MAG: hypothetical protein QOE15_1138, partial [Acidimicrobiaceae bacterium]|nr:hypothetical protein [Acidimicrobiaceae bacterium]